MSKISTYPDITIPSLSDLLLGTDVSDSNNTKNFEIRDVLFLLGSTLLSFNDNAAALAGGLSVGSLYKTPTGEVRIVV